ncbi:PTS sugar transporter subunit IIA [Anaerorhabdus sp.]|nr:PTS sugar transporter subunit IIA [Anaerorhabdus sp.]MEA4875883.1 PTS sugar transporter subunit IIA [Anaerorhabdus sp.]
MKKYLIISHGNFAIGIADTLKLFLGENHPFHAISAYTNGNDNIDEMIAAFMDTVAEEDELLICSDISGGSVNQKMMTYLNRPKTYILAGMNLPMLLQLAMIAQDREITIDDCRLCISEAKEGLVLVNDLMQQNNTDIDE